MAFQINCERERIHHGAAAALADIRRQSMRSVTDNSDASGGPAFELDKFESVVAALHTDAIDQRLQRREPALPIVLAHRHCLGDFVRVEHGERDVDVVFAAWGVKDPPRARPILDGLAVAANALRRGSVHQQARAAVDQIFTFREQSE